MSTHTGLGPGPDTRSSWSTEMERESPLGGESRQEKAGTSTTGGGRRKNWAQLLGSTLPNTLNKNILEVVLEKDNKGAFLVTDNDCAKLMRKIGLDLRPGVHVEGVQLCPNGRGVILITLKDGVGIDSFCMYDTLQVTESGIRTTLVKPAGKREVTVTVKGIHPNTKDSVVLDYLGKFGRIVTTKVVHDVFKEGPLRGMKNGDRAYKLEVKPGENVGSYHIIDGHKVSLRYAGQQQTCGRCHDTPQNCKGRGIARRCEAEGGMRIEFTDYIVGLWKKIGYTPSNDDLDGIGKEVDEKVEEVVQFTPPKIPVGDKEKYAGVSIRYFPKEADHGDVVEFLCSQGVPEEMKEDIKIKSNGSVTIDNLDNATSVAIIDAIHGKVNFGRKLFCNGFIPLTPDKPKQDSAMEHSGSPTSAVQAQQVPTATSLRGSAGSPTAVVAQAQHVPAPTSPSGPAGSPTRTPGSPTNIEKQPPLVPDFETHSNLFISSPGSVARRHSISLVNRTPPGGSLAAELLNSTNPNLLKTASLLSEIRTMSEQLSDFGSCLSSISNSESDSLVESGEDLQKVGGYQTLNERKRNKKKKRKLKLTPGKEEFLKKPNLLNSA